MKCSNVFLLFFFVSTSVLGQDTLTGSTYFKSYLTDTKDIIVSPLSWNGRDAVNAVVVAGGTALFMVYDEQIDDFIFKNLNSTVKDVSHYGLSPFGNGIYTIPLLGVLYLTGVNGRNTYDRNVALLGLKTFVLAAGEATVIKMAFQRHRPIDDTPPDSWQFDGPFKYFSDDGSFVSRHATTSFALAAVLSESYKEKKKWVPWVAYSLASLVTVSRVYEREHWASDVFAGACIGYFTGKLMFKLNKGSLKNK